ncbi:MAG: polysulfide reductase NrfD [Acidimicrobiia bacterium]|nr:polysulfide reductase NrfD [Acidimicrobiia bacterium]NNL70828.1 polysulfide reductase NrfD [Acidimicrobiia bacterium]
MRYGFVIDQDTCIGCHACTVACKTEHDVPLGVNRTWVKYIEKGTWPDTSRFFSVMRCNHCTDAPCVEICPTTALFKRDDGIVDFDTDRCIGCKSCMQACPYDALYIDPGENTAQKCNYCVHRVEVGIEPACVVVCPEQAIIAGDLDDPTTRIAQVVAGEEVFVRSPEQGTRPNLWYKGVEQANLDPLSAETTVDSYIWRDPPNPVQPWMSVDLTPKNGHEPQPPPGFAYGRNGAPPRVVYNTDHPMPWGWRVSSYFLTKGIAAGLALAVAIALLAGAESGSALINWVAPLVAGLFLAGTGALLVADLKRPDRFFYLLTKGRWGSWLVRGAVILSAYAVVLGLWFLAGIAGADDLVKVLVWIAVPIALAAAGYTAFLFGQAEARDLWQSPILLWHMVAGAFAVGGGAGLILDLFLDVPEEATTAFTWAMVGGSAALGLIAFAELTSRHPTRNIADAMHHMTKGVYSREWWLGGQVLGVVVPIALGVIALGGATWVGAIGGVSAMAGIWFADDAFVKAGQSVPLS